MKLMVLTSFTTQVYRLISKNASFELCLTLVGCTVIAAITYMLLKIRKQQKKTYTDYLRASKENASNIEKIKDLISKGIKTNQELTLAKKEAKELQKEIRKQEKNDQELKKKCDNIKKEHVSLRKDYDELKCKYVNNSHTLSSIRMQLGKAQKTISNIKDELESTKTEKTAMLRSLNDLETAMKEKDKTILDKSSTISELVEKNSEKDQILSEKEALIAEKVSEISSIRMQLGKAKKAISNIKEEQESTITENGVMLQNLKDLETVMKDKDKTILDKNSTISELAKKISEKDQILSEKEAHINELESTKATYIANCSNTEELEKEIDMLSKQLEDANLERDQKGKELSEQIKLAESRGEEIERITAEIRDAKDKINALNNEINVLKSQVKTKEQTNEKNDKDVRSNPPRIEREYENSDLPTIEISTGNVKRSILQVIDVEQEKEVLIDTDEFFNRTSEEIESVARMLEEAAASGREAYICACCSTPVKISKRDFGNKEVLFFSHCKHDTLCDWKQEHGHYFPNFNVNGKNVEDGEPYDYKAKYREIKNLIEKSLKTENSKAIGISEVEADKKIKSKHYFIYNRTAGIYAKYKDKDIVIELQTKDVLMNTVVNKDIFYRLNDKNVIWIFGADETGGYNYINKHVQRNTMLANRRNVFIMDKEAMEACKKRQELVLKCNYLDPNGSWHYRMDTTGNNGVLITLDNLIFDNDMCKPYFFDANKEFFKENPKIEEEYFNNIVPREKLLKDLQDKWDGKVAERRRKQSRKKKEAQKEEPVTSFTGYKDRFIYTFKGKKGLVDSKNNFIIPCEYHDIQVWARGKYRVKKIDLWGIMDESQQLIVDIKYKEIGELKSGKALIKTFNESYFIYENGKRVADEMIKLPNGWIKFRQGSQMGIKDSNGNIIVDCIYDEIGSFRGRLIGFYKGVFQKLNARFEYHMPISCMCINNDDARANYDIKGVKMLETLKKTATLDKIYHDKQINNISFAKNIIYISTISEKKKNIKINHVDQDCDFRLNEIVTVAIDTIKGNKIFVSTNDGRKTYITHIVLTKAGKSLSSYPPGTFLRIKKIGFDSDFERTIWEYVKEEN